MATQALSGSESLVAGVLCWFFASNSGQHRCRDRRADTTTAGELGCSLTQ